MVKTSLSHTNLDVFVEPPDITFDNLEDFLATDSLFVDYFNVFLSLPNFMDPMYFNQETGAFEIVSKDKKYMSKQIKTAILSEMAKSKLRETVMKQNFKNISLFPMEPPPKAKVMEIKTNFTVEILNRHQGIKWIKAKRLPGFLQSSLYQEYRLAKIVAQAKILQEDGKFVIMKLKHVPKKSETKMASEVMSDTLMGPYAKDVYVCTGNSQIGSSEAIYKISDTEFGTKTSSATKIIVKQYQTAITPRGRPEKSASSIKKPIRNIGKLTVSLDGLFEDISIPHLLARYSKPVLLESCVIDNSIDEEGDIRGHTAYIIPTGNEIIADNESAKSKESIGKEFSKKSPPEEDEDYIKGIHEYAASFVADIFKTALIEIFQSSEVVPTESPDIKRLFNKDQSSSWLSKEEPKSERKKHPDSILQKKMKEKKVKEDDGEDSDSLIFGDDEEIPTDKRRKIYPLTCIKGIEHFKKFLAGTVGERHWFFWTDVDHLRNLSSDAEEKMHVAIIKEKYYNSGGIHELSEETKKTLDMTEPYSWTAPRLLEVQNFFSKSLLIYWAPQYLLRCLLETNPYEYHRYCKFYALMHRSDLETFPSRIKESKYLQFLPPWSKELEKFPELKPKSITSSSIFGIRPSYTSGLDVELAKSSNSLQLPESLSKAQKENKVDNEEFLGSQFPSLLFLQLSQPDFATSFFPKITNPNRLQKVAKHLQYDKLSGGFFTSFVKQSENKLWINCLNAWKEIWEYLELFKMKATSPYALGRKAHLIFSRYVADGADCCVSCEKHLLYEVFQNLHEPDENTFDGVLEYLVEILQNAWKLAMRDDLNAFRNVELTEAEGYLETNSKHVAELQKKGIIKTKVLNPVNPMEGYKDPVTKEIIKKQIPKGWKDCKLENIINCDAELINFRHFLIAHFAVMDLDCWLDIQSYRITPHTNEKLREEKAKAIKKIYLNKKYFFGPTSPVGQDGKNKVMAAGGGWGKLLQERPPNPVLILVQKYVKERLENKWMPLFLSQPDFVLRQKSGIGVEDMVENLLLIKQSSKKKHVKHGLEEMWISSLEQMNVFRNSLVNPITSIMFRKYLFDLGGFLENDVLFWLEVKTYTELYHAGANMTVLQQKLTSIINCYINAETQPHIRIDIRNETAKHILYHRYAPSPDLLDKAQLEIFNCLMPYWNDFCQYRKNSLLTDFMEYSKIDSTVSQDTQKDKLKKDFSWKDAAARNAGMNEEMIKKSFEGSEFSYLSYFYEPVRKDTKYSLVFPTIMAFVEEENEEEEEESENAGKTEKSDHDVSQDSEFSFKCESETSSVNYKNWEKTLVFHGHEARQK